MKKYAMKIKPYISETIWGGRRLINEYGIETEKSNAAEGWMLSCLENGYGTVINGEFEGMPLPAVLKDNPSLCGEKLEDGADFPILIKFIDAMDDLSVQVHPTKEYCEKTGRGRSKTECWYIIDCDEDARLILGFKDKISKNEFKAAVENGHLTDYTDSVKVKKGDFFFIESGTLHAICRGVLLAEVQESSDTTYRIFDYNRKGKDGKPRELHVSDALEVTKLEKYSQPVFEDDSPRENKKLLAACDLFRVWHVTVQDKFADYAGKDSFVSLLIMNGEATLTVCGEDTPVRKGESIFIPADCGEYIITGNADILETRI